MGGISAAPRSKQIRTKRMDRKWGKDDCSQTTITSRQNKCPQEQGKLLGEINRPEQASSTHQQEEKERIRVRADLQSTLLSPAPADVLREEDARARRRTTERKMRWREEDRPCCRRRGRRR
jgi:hypothetical protein